MRNKAKQPKPKKTRAEREPPARGRSRQWTRCKKCRNVAYYDYQPHSLSNPVRWLPCGHGLTVRLDAAVDFITEAEALVGKNGG